MVPIAAIIAAKTLPSYDIFEPLTLTAKILFEESSKSYNIGVKQATMMSFRTPLLIGCTWKMKFNGPWRRTTFILR